MFPFLRLAPLLFAACYCATAYAQVDLISWEAAGKTLNKYCSECHSEDLPEADLNITSIDQQTDLQADPEKWNTVLQALRTHYMPHAEGRNLPLQRRQELIDKIRAELIQLAASYDSESANLRRLNRTEFSHTLNDLLFLDGDWSESLPADNAGYGFDNIAAALSISPLLIERYFAISSNAALTAVPLKTPSNKWSISATDFSGGILSKGNRVIASAGAGRAARHAIFFPGKGEYTLRLRLSAQQAGSENARAELHFDDQLIGDNEVTAHKNDKPTTVKHTVKITTPGEHKVEIRMAKDFYKETESGAQDRNLIFHGISIEGPFQTAEDLNSPFLDRHFGSLPERLSASELRDGVHRFASRAYRRPVTSEEVESLWAVFITNSKYHGAKNDVRYGLYAVLDAVLTSPSFLFRLETSEHDNEFALASWLSYFLWSSMPDDRLFQLAHSQELRANIGSELQRMLQDPKAVALADNFAGQWWRFRDLDIHKPDTSVYQAGNKELLASMKEETKRFFLHVLKEDRSLLDFLNADYTFVDKRLAKHYGLKGVQGDAFQKVSIAETPRRGVWSQAGILTVTSYPNHTSPVLRGQWILENIMGLSPPPPPDNIPSLPGTEGAPDPSDLRASLALHRDNPDCASCHNIMDPFGLTLEHYDGVGRLRSRDERAQLSPETLFDGTEIYDPVDLAQYFEASRSDDFVLNLARKLSIYAAGRGLDWRDEAALQRIADQTENQDYRFSALVHAVAIEFAPAAKSASLTSIAPTP